MSFLLLCIKLYNYGKIFQKYIVFNMCSCYVLKKTSRASVFEAMHCTAHDLCDDSESRVRFHKRKEDLWNSEVWCSPFAPALWLWSCVSAFSPPRFTSKSIPSCVMQAHVRSCAGAFFEVPAFFCVFSSCPGMPKRRPAPGIRPAPLFPSPARESSLLLQKCRAARRTMGDRGRLSPPAGRGAAPLCLSRLFFC